MSAGFVCCASDWLPQDAFANAFASEATIFTRSPSAMFASIRCRPQSGVGDALGTCAPGCGVICSTLAPFAVEHFAV